MAKFKVSDIKIRKRKGGSGRKAQYTELYKEILNLDIGDGITVPVPEGSTVDKTRNTWTQRIVSVIRPMLMKEEGVSARHECSKDFSAVLLDDSEDEIGIVCEENTLTEEMEEKFKERAKLQQATRAANTKAKKAEKAPATTPAPTHAKNKGKNKGGKTAPVSSDSELDELDI